MSTTSARPGTVGWFDLVATDPTLIQKFLEELLGWVFEVHGDGSYLTITGTDGEEPIGALRAGERDALTPGVVCTDPAEAVRSLEALGSRVVEPPRLTPAGDVHAVVTEVRGNRLGLFRPATLAEPVDRDRPVPNTPAFFEIGTTDVPATRAFYRRAFDWALERDEAAEGVTYYSIVPSWASREIGGVLDLTGIPGTTDYVVPTLCVRDVADLLERVTTAGGTPVMGPITDANGLTVAQFLDPVGNQWSSFALPASG